MGGPDSGRYWAQRSIEDCRCLALGELVDHGRHRRIPKGRILWRNRESARTVGRLTYRFSVLIGADDGVHLPLLTYTYWSAPWEAVVEDFLELRIEAGKAIVAYCPREECRRPVRTLYAPPGKEFFLCRSCWSLSYPRSKQEKIERYISEFCDPLLAGLTRRPAAEGRLSGSRTPEEALALLEGFDLDWALGPRERRLACLQLAAAGFSLRQIATETGISKSSVARLLITGVDALDQRELLAERLHRYYPLSAAQRLAALQERPPAAEIRLLLPADQ